MFSCKELRSSAQASLKGKYFKYFLLMLVFVIINTLTTPSEDNFSLLLYGANFIISIIFSTIIYSVDLNIAREKNTFLPSIDTNFFKTCFKLIILSLVVSIPIIIGLILFIVPGIIVGMMLSQSYYILIEDNTKSIFTCMRESCSIIDGYLINYLKLQLYFLLFIVLGIITLGIGFFWILPIIQVSNAKFYLCLKEKAQL